MIIIDLNTLRNIASRFDKKFAFNSQKSKMYKKAKFDSMFHFLSRVAHYKNIINQIVFTNCCTIHKRVECKKNYKNLVCSIFFRK